jgi:hypothetical protein
MASGLPDRAEWDGLIRDRADPSDGPSLSVIVGAAGSSWSSPVRVTGSDLRDYFAKFPEACPGQAQMSVVTEMVVARAGRMIGAPTCETVVMTVPSELQGEELKPGVEISSVVVHASLALDNCDERRPGLPPRGKDDNRSRHVGCYALYDWFMGCDQQWLRDLDDDMATYSHDHGLYLPPVNSGHWTDQDLQAQVGVAWPLPDDPKGLSPTAANLVADALRGIARNDIQTLLSAVPVSWAVTDQQLEGLGWFLECRAPAVAGRIEQLVSI